MFWVFFAYISDIVLHGIICISALYKSQTCTFLY